jgi:hypothetical protein
VNSENGSNGVRRTKKPEGVKASAVIERSVIGR